MTHNAIESAQDVDYEYLTRMPGWSCDKVAALTLGLYPDLALHIGRQRRLFPRNPLVVGLQKIRKLIRRSADERRSNDNDRLQ
jgi:hypothetical protein